MSTQTTYYELNKPGSSDLVNPLVDTFPNWDIIDTEMHNNYLLGVTTATEIVTTGVHALTRANTDLPFFRYVATANFNAGDTFTLDGTSVTAHTTDGSSLGDDDIVAGAVVLACYNSTNTTITLFVSAKQSTIALAEDSEKLESHPASYFATAGDLNNTNANKFDSTGIAPAYNSNTTYSVGDVVTYQGKRYECNTNMAQAEAWDSTHWNLIPVQTKLNNLQLNVGDLTQLTTNDKSSLVAAIDEVKSTLPNIGNITNLGTAIDIKSYVHPTIYTTPSDGYIDFYGNSGAQVGALCGLYTFGTTNGNQVTLPIFIMQNDTANAGKGVMFNTFVKKGTKVAVALYGDGTINRCNFYPINS